MAMICARLALPLLFWIVSAADISGDWRVKASFDSASPRNGVQHVDLVCAFEQHGGALTGSCRPPGGAEGAPFVGNVAGHDVEWRFDIALAAQEARQTVRFAGRLADDERSIDGRFTVGDSTGTFDAHKE